MTTNARCAGTAAALAMILVVAGPSPARAQAGPVGPRPAQAGAWVDPAGGLSIDDVIALALGRSPMIQAARAEVDEARGERIQARLRPNPGLTFERRDETGGMGNQTMVVLNWPLDLFRRAGRTAVADRGVTAADEAAVAEEWRVATEVREQAGRVLAALREFETAEAVAAVARSTRDLIAARVDTGAAPALERDMADVEWRRLEAAAIRRRAMVDTAMLALKAVVGLDAAEPLRLRDTLEAVVVREVEAGPPGVSTPDVADEAGARPDVRRAEAAVSLARAGEDLARREGRFDVNLMGGYMNMRAGFPQSGLDASGLPTPIGMRSHTVIVGAMVMLPWRNRNQGEVAARAAAAAAAGHELEGRRLSAVADLEAARIRDREAARALEIFTGGTRDLAARNVAVMQESYQLGRATLVDVLEETRRFLDFEMAYTDALAEAYDARVALQRALGVIR